MSTIKRIATKPALALVRMEIKSNTTIASTFLFAFDQFLNFTMLGRV